MNKEVIKFHQFVKIEKGPVNTALIDMLKGHVYQVENEVIEAMNQGRHDEIKEFISVAWEAELLVYIDPKDWIPPCAEVPEDLFDDFLEKELNIELHVEQGANLEAVLEKLKYHNIERVLYYGPEIPHVEWKGKIERKEKNFAQCMAQAYITGEFEPITEHMYIFNKKHNSCWGKKLTVTGDGKVRPCIHSNVVVGDIFQDNIDDIMENLEKKYWLITNDMVKKCNACELRYVCFNCRELALKRDGDLSSPNPECKYDPYKGTWNT